MKYTALLITSFVLFAISADQAEASTVTGQPSKDSLLFPNGPAAAISPRELGHLKQLFQAVIELERSYAKEHRLPYVTVTPEQEEEYSFADLTERLGCHKEFPLNPFAYSPYLLSVSAGHALQIADEREVHTMYLNAVVRRPDSTSAFVCRYFICEGYGYLCLYDGKFFYPVETFELDGSGTVLWSKHTFAQVVREVVEFRETLQEMWLRMPETLFSILKGLNDQDFASLPKTDSLGPLSYTELFRRLKIPKDQGLDNPFLDTVFEYRVWREEKPLPQGGTFTQISVFLSRSGGTYALIDLQYFPELGYGAIGLIPSFYFLDRFLTFEVDPSGAITPREKEILQDFWREYYSRLNALKTK